MGILDPITSGDRCATCGHEPWVFPHVCDGCGRQENDPDWIDVEWVRPGEGKLTDRIQHRTVCSWACLEMLAVRQGESCTP